MNWVLVNRREDLAGAQTTAELVARLSARAPTRVIEIAELGMDPTGAVLAGEARLAAGDRVMIRTNPARDTRGHDQRMALDLLSVAQRQGVVVMNDPDTLSRAMTKVYLSTLPESLRPRTLVSRDPVLLRRFVEDAPGRTVIKPVSGTRGRDVFLLHAGADNLPQIIDVVVRQGLAMVQDFVPEAVDGDMRVVVLGGRILTVGGQRCAVRRVPPADDFRSNVAVGGHPAAANPSAAVVDVAERAAQHLLADGIHLAGLDVIGTVLVEVNVFATGGLQDAGAFAECNFFEPVLDYFEALGA